MDALMAGQVRFSREEKPQFEQVVAPPRGHPSGDARLSGLYAGIPVLPIREVRLAADMLFCLCERMVRQEGGGEEAAPDEPMESGAPARSGETSAESGWPACENATLRPALEYIHINRSEAVTQKQMADLCHVSTNYFSRLFSREMGEGFTSFLARQRVAWSKRLLEETALPVGQISERLGFSSCGYFIKTFRRYESVTPSVYRRRCVKDGGDEKEEVL